MEKLLVAILLLAALYGIPSTATDSRIEWTIVLNSDGQARAELRIEPSNRIEWRVLLRNQDSPGRVRQRLSFTLEILSCLK